MQTDTTPTPLEAAREWLKGYRGLQDTFDVRSDHESIALTIAQAAFVAGAGWERDECAGIAKAVADDAAVRRTRNQTEPNGGYYVQGEEDAADRIERAIRARAAADEVGKGREG